jgi:hypothetical protein
MFNTLACAGAQGLYAWRARLESLESDMEKFIYKELRRLRLAVVVVVTLHAISAADAQGVEFTWSPAVALDGQGALELCVAGDDGALHFIVQKPNGPNGGWSDWQGVGGLTLGGPPTAAANQNGLVDVFVKGPDGALWHITQPSSGSSSWSSLGGAVGSITAVGMNFDGRLEAFTLGTDAALNHVWQLTPGGNWSGWQSFGGTGTSIPTVARNADGRLEVFVVGNDFPTHHLYHLWQLTPGGGWSGWNSLDGAISPQPSAAQNADGRLEVFAIGNDVFSGMNTTHDWQMTPGGGWSGFNSLGNPPGQNSTLSPQVIANQDRRLEVFGVDSSGAVWHNWQTVPNGAWSGWSPLGSAGGGTNFDLAVGRNADGRLEIFMNANDHAIWHNWQVPGVGWSGWVPFSQAQ